MFWLPWRFVFYAKCSFVSYRHVTLNNKLQIYHFCSCLQVIKAQSSWTEREPLTISTWVSAVVFFFSNGLVDYYFFEGRMGVRQFPQNIPALQKLLKKIVQTWGAIYGEKGWASVFHWACPIFDVKKFYGTSYNFAH